LSFKFLLHFSHIRLCNSLIIPTQIFKSRIQPFKGSALPIAFFLIIKFFKEHANRSKRKEVTKNKVTACLLVILKKVVKFSTDFGLSSVECLKLVDKLRKS